MTIGEERRIFTTVRIYLELSGEGSGDLLLWLFAGIGGEKGGILPYIYGLGGDRRCAV